jgi:DNA-binding NarL/FixJ family response regulator
MGKVLIVDGHGLYRKGLSEALAAILPTHRVVDADSLEAARREFSLNELESALIDVATPGVSWDVLRSLHQRHPKTRLIALSATESRADVICALEHGLFGFISKSQSDEEIFGAVKDVLSGRIYVPPMLAQVDEPADHSPSDRLHAPCSQSTTELLGGKLTRRQRDILPLLARGMSNKEIARALKIAEGTIKIHASSLLRVLGVRNRTEAAILAQHYILSNSDSYPPDRELNNQSPRRL